MLHKRFHQVIIALGLIALILAAALVAQRTYARSLSRPVAQASALHPTFPMLDDDGENVLESAAPLSTMQTCGQCHDTEFISTHSFHVDLGLSDQVDAGQVPGGQPWDTSPGLYGKWNPLTYR